MADIDISSIATNNICVFPASGRGNTTQSSTLLTEDRVARMLSSSPMKAWVISGNSSSSDFEFVLDGHYFKATGLSLGGSGNPVYASIDINAVADNSIDPTGSGMFNVLENASDVGGNFTGLRIFSTSSAIPIDTMTNMNVNGTTRTMMLLNADGSTHMPEYKIDCGTI